MGFSFDQFCEHTNPRHDQKLLLTLTQPENVFAQHQICGKTDQRVLNANSDCKTFKQSLYLWSGRRSDQLHTVCLPVTIMQQTNRYIVSCHVLS